MDKFEMIRQFKELLDAGVITQEEFDQKKRKILSLDDDIQPQAEVKPLAEVSLNEVPADEASEVEVTEPSDAVSVMGAKTNVQTPAPEQKASSKKVKIIIGVVAAIVVLLLISLVGSGGSSGIKGSWNCYSVTYAGESMTASDAQMDDYTFKFTDSTFEANIYGAEGSGTYEYTETVTLNNGAEADVYTLTADNGAQFTVAYFKSLKLLTLTPSGGVSDQNYIAFKRK